MTLFVALSLGVVRPDPAAAAAPTQPGSLTAFAVTASSASLSWTAATDDVEVLGYRVYRALGTTSDPTLIATTDAKVLSYSAAGLRSGSPYRFSVAAIDADEAESPQASVSVTTGASSDTTAPAAPSSTAVTLTAVSSSRVDVVWSASSSSDVSFYEVLRGGQVVGTVERPSALTWSDNGLSASTSYSYAVRAVDSAGNRSPATTAKTKTTLAAGAVGIIRGPYVVRTGPTSASVAWWTNIASSGSVSVGGSVVEDATTDIHHEVLVTDLTSGTAYSYTVTSGGSTASGSFRTAPGVDTSFSFSVIGDYGTQSAQEKKNAANIAASGSDFLLTVGDNIYPSSGFVDPDPARQLSDLDTRVFAQFAGAFRAMSFFPANGNKDYYGGGGFQNAFPVPGSGTQWYSFDWGPAHILVLDSNQPYGPGTAQYDFAQADLEGHLDAPWNVVVVHHPPYSSTTKGAGTLGVRRDLVPLFEANAVDLVLSGDTHNYQRSYPMLQGQRVSTGGVTYVITGGGGTALSSFASTSPQPDWQAFRQAIHEQLKIDVTSTTLTLTAVAASDGHVVDSATLTRSTDTTAPTAPTLLTATPGGTTVSLAWSPSSDNTGVTGYRVYRDGARVASPTGAAYDDVGLAPGTYRYEVSAVDTAGNESPLSTAATATVASDTTTVTVAPAADRIVNPATGLPEETRLRVDGSPQIDFLVKFALPTSCTPVSSARLDLTVGSGSTDPSDSGGQVYATSLTDPNAGWSETTVVWGTAPAKVGTPVSLAGSVAASTTYSADVTTLLPQAGGTFTLRAASTSNDAAAYYSKEGSASRGPRLTVTCG